MGKQNRLRSAASALALMALMAAPGRAGAGENARLVLVRSQVGSGAVAASGGVQMTLAQPIGVAATPPESPKVGVYPGYLAPPTDRQGLVTRERIKAILLGEAAPPAEPVAIDFAGNRDGRIDVADLILAERRQLP